MMKLPYAFQAWLNAMQLTLALRPVLDQIDTIDFHQYLTQFYNYEGEYECTS